MEPSAATNPEDVYQRLRRPIESAVGLPGEWYSSEAFSREEARRLFARTWMCAGYAHELGAPGDVVPVDLAHYSLLFTRTEAGEIKAYHNVCPHRGMRLIDAPERGHPILKCPYHAWAFDMEGRLKSTPHWGGYRVHALEGFDPACHGLQAVRCERWHDWLFVNVDGKAPPLAEYMAPFTPHFERYALERLVHAECARYEIRGNWKIVEENFLEVLHLPPVHRRLSEYAPFQNHDMVHEGTCLGTVIETGLPASWVPEPLPRYPGVSGEAQNAKNLALFPNFKLVIGPDHCCSMVEFPAGASLTRQRWDFYFIGEGATAPELEPARREIIDFFRETNEEDLGAIERLHQGRCSPGYRGGVFSKVWEPVVHHFQTLVAGYLSRAL